MLWVRVPFLVLWIFSLKIEETYTFMNIIFCWAEWNLTNKLRPQIYVCRKNPIWIVNTIGCTDPLRIATKLKYSSHSSKLLAVYFKTCLNSQSTTSDRGSSEFKHLVNFKCTDYGARDYRRQKRYSYTLSQFLYQESPPWSGISLFPDLTGFYRHVKKI